MTRAVRIFLIVALLIAFTASPASASIACDPHRNGDGQHRWAGWMESQTSQSGQITGVRGFLEAGYGYASLNSGASHWIMLSAPATGEYIQIGFLTQNVAQSTSSKIFIEWEDNPTIPGYSGINTYGMGISGPMWDFEIRYSGLGGGNGRYWVYIEGTQYLQIDLTFVPTRAEAFGEQGSSADAVAGTISDPANFSQLKIKTTQSGGFQSYGSQPTTPSSFSSTYTGLATNVSSGAMSVWDKWCA